MVSRVRRSGAALFLAAALLSPLVVAPGLEAAASGRIGVVIDHDGMVDGTRCVKIRTESIRAIDLLTKKTDLGMYTEAFGTFGRAICWLDGEGGMPGGCFNDAQGRSWNVYLRKRRQESPKLAAVGISTLEVPAGSVLHFVYAGWQENPPGSGNFEPPPIPDKVGLASICEG